MKKGRQRQPLHQFKQIYPGIKGRPMAVHTNQMNGLTVSCIKPGFRHNKSSKNVFQYV